MELIGALNAMVQEGEPWAQDALEVIWRKAHLATLNYPEAAWRTHPEIQRVLQQAGRRILKAR